jgi:two-component system, response regulator PhcR
LTASSADEALTILDARSGEIAVLVTDYYMPTRDGLSLLRAAQRDHRYVIRLLATAYAEKDVTLAAINQGRVLQILEKPFNDAEVRLALHDALARYRARARDQEVLEGRAAAMRETLGFLAHELNTPLATVLGYMDVLKTRHELAVSVPVDDRQSGTGPAGNESPRPAARIDNTLSVIEAAARRTQYALSLVATFVQSARDAYPGARPAALHAGALIRALLDDYPFDADERASVTCDLAGDFPLPGQRDLLYLVLCTLTKNALFALRGQPQPNLHIALQTATQTGAGATPYAVIRLSDNGPGIAPEILAKLTREPVTTRAAQGGSGMGLLFCRRVVQSMGGLIEVNSTLGAGTSITLLFKPDEHLERVDP